MYCHKLHSLAYMFAADICRRQYGSNFNYGDVIGPKAAEFGYVTKNNGRPLRRSRSFKVISFGTNGNLVCNSYVNE